MAVYSSVKPIEEQFKILKLLADVMEFKMNNLNKNGWQG
jgi:hypothetical protein